MNFKLVIAFFVLIFVVASLTILFHQRLTVIKITQKTEQAVEKTDEGNTGTVKTKAKSLKRWAPIILLIILIIAFQLRSIHSKRKRGYRTKGKKERIYTPPKSKFTDLDLFGPFTKGYKGGFGGIKERKL